MKPRSLFLRSHAVSAAMGGLYALLLHLAVWLGYAVAYLAADENGNHLPKLFVPWCIMLVGLIAFVVVKSLPAESLTFFGTVLLVHLLLSLSFFWLGGYLTPLLQSIKGVLPPVDSPDGDLSNFYVVINWLVLSVGMGLLLFFLAVIFTVRDALRRSMGYIPKERKRKRKSTSGDDMSL